MKHDLTGKKFNRLTVIKEHGHIGKKLSWECECECGKTTYVCTNDIISGNTKSCGCWNHEVCVNRFLTHGKRNHPLYNTWAKMRQRCYNPKSVDYKNYGGRGITISESWQNFENFLSDMEVGYKKGLSIDRIDNDKGYCKENCKWATKKHQNNNKRNNIVVTFNGITDTLPNMAERFELNYEALYRRLYRGMKVEEAFNKPFRKRTKKQ